MSYRFPALRPMVAACLVAFPFFSFASPAPATPDAGDGTTVLPRVTVADDRADIAPARDVDGDSLRVAASSDTASLLANLPGVFVNPAGGVSGLPSIRGLADDRLRIAVDGADISASCPNHMNPALSYLPPAAVGTITVYPGITPVSVGGDSIGGSIVAERAPMRFAAPGEGIVVDGEVGVVGRSNGHVLGANARVAVASERFSLRYTGNSIEADNYHAAEDFKEYGFTGRAGHALDRDEVGSSAYTVRNQNLDVAWSRDGHLLEATVGWQRIPEQGFPNQRMDLLRNDQQRVNLHYAGELGWGRLEVRAYREDLEHLMDFGADKRFFYGAASRGSNPPYDNGVSCEQGRMCATGMPMNTDSDSSALSMDADIRLTGDDRLRLGVLHRRYRLDDWWPASGGMMMAPNTFWNIRDGQRDRSALYAEWERHFDTRWTAEIGARFERVRMDAGPVQGYSMMDMMGSNVMRDVAAFNAADRAHSDGNLDLSAIVRHAHDQNLDIAFGLSRKVRSPGIYEVYTWSTWQMAALMNNFVGDGNGYVGNLALRPERAVTASATFDWHAADRRWELQVTPYWTRVSDYIDAVQWDAAANAPRSTPLVGAFSVLKYVNQSARLRGVDVSGSVVLGETAWGRFGFEGKVDYLDGRNTETDDGLINQMPLNARLALTQRSNGWDNALELVAVDRKDDVSRVRNELVTPGYALLNLRFSKAWEGFRVDFGIENLLDRSYSLPTGGAYLGQGSTMTNPMPPDYPQWGVPVPGPGRSVYLGLNLSF
ncbi:MAG: TonB-dependent receptor [Xanthomonadales bacterium]|nr:TonB-dependent receptor [Xanthomonadales bacterium]